MPRTALPNPVEVNRAAGVALVAGPASDFTNGNEMANDGKIFLYIENDVTAGRTVTFDLLVNSVDGVTVPDKVLTLGASAKVLHGPYPVDLYGPLLLINTSNVAVTIKPYRAL